MSTVRPIRTRTVIGTRPSQAPHGYVIYNAPRPIYGVEWIGDFCSGIFYTALNPECPDFAKLHELNRRQDAVVLTYIDEEEAYQKGRERLLALRPLEAAELVDLPEHRNWIVQRYLNHLNCGDSN